MAGNPCPDKGYPVFCLKRSEDAKISMTVSEKQHAI